MLIDVAIGKLLVRIVVSVRQLRFHVFLCARFFFEFIESIALGLVRSHHLYTLHPFADVLVLHSRRGLILVVPIFLNKLCCAISIMVAIRWVKFNFCVRTSPIFFRLRWKHMILLRSRPIRMQLVLMAFDRSDFIPSRFRLYHYLLCSHDSLYVIFAYPALNLFNF